MFTGIVQGTAEVVGILEKENFRTHTIRLPEKYCAGLETGASVAHNGSCLTVTRIEGDLVSFDLMQETLRVTNLSQLSIGDKVNFERAARFGDEIGGHQMSGHILCMAEVTRVVQGDDNLRIGFRLARDWHKYIFTKGYIGVDGISLTIGKVDSDGFEVNLIPETRQRTNLGNRQPGELVNIEIDPQTQAIVDTVERLISDKGF